ncbi:hypothetical protein R52603_05306 [Paraburkholderia saeva]|nr:hypothetical protein R52603_05306 [Paraburkholderia saeva]
MYVAALVSIVYIRLLKFPASKVALTCVPYYT